MTITNAALAKKLTSKYKDQFKATKNRTFGLSKKDIGTENWKFRRLITNVMVGGSNEDNVIAAAELIFRSYPNPKALAHADRPVLVGIMNKNHVRFSKNKAVNITKVASIIENCEDGVVPRERELLESMPGVGPHVAQTVRALAFNVPSFSVDLHVRRIAKRIGLATEKASDLKVEKACREGIRDCDLLPAYSRAFVEFGKEICGAEPDCGNCFIKKDCATGSGIAVKAVKKTAHKHAAVKDGRFGVVAGSSETEYFVTVNGSKISCNCKGYRFKRTCSHVKTITGEI
jgi:endonuclease-3